MRTQQTIGYELRCNTTAKLIAADLSKVDHEQVQDEIEFYGTINGQPVYDYMDENDCQLYPVTRDLLSELIEYYGGKYSKQGSTDLRIADHGLNPLNNDRYDHAEAMLSVVVGWQETDSNAQLAYFGLKSNEKQIYISPDTTLADAVREIEINL